MKISLTKILIGEALEDLMEGIVVVLEAGIEGDLME